MAARRGICEAGDRDLEILIASVEITPSKLTYDKTANACARLSACVTHVRELAGGGAQVHLAPLSHLKNRSGTAYLRNVVDALGKPRLQDPELAAMRRTIQDEVIASALVLIITGQHVFRPPAHQEWAERLGRSWGWKGPRPNCPAEPGSTRTCSK